MTSYSGHVDPQGTPARRELPEAVIVKKSVGPMDNNAYLLICRDTGDALLIDAANDADDLLDVITQDPLHPVVRAVVTTHRHADHWQALAAVAEATGAPLYAGAEDAGELPVPVDHQLRHGDEITVGALCVSVVALRGHTPGSIAIRYDDPSGSTHLFTGDSLFPGGPGRTISPDDFTSLMDDLEERVFGVMDDDTAVYPGHGDDTTLGTERPHLAEWRARGW